MLRACAEGWVGARCRALKTNPTRLVAVDVARVLAIIFMIQGHTLDVLLAPEYRQGLFYNIWLFLRGLTAPMFFLLAGVAFTLSSTKHWDSYRTTSPQFFRRLRKFTWFIALGYILHFPVKSFADFKFLDATGWQSWLESDVLQCIGVTLIGMQLLILASRTPARFAIVSALLGCGIVFASSSIWTASASMQHLPLWLASYVSGNTGSWFPIFPWSAFVLIGSALGYVFTTHQQSTADCCLPTVPLLSIGSLLALLGMILLYEFPPPMGDNTPADVWKANPAFFLSRLGLVIIILGIVGWITNRIRVPYHAIRCVAEESLLIYFVHICILYGCVWHTGVADCVGAILPPTGVVPWITVLVISMLVLGWTWNQFKKAAPTRGLVIRYVTIALMVVYGLR